MAGKNDNQPPAITEKDITEKDIVGLKYFHQIGDLLEQLQDVGCEGDKAGNRTLHMDQYCMLVLLYLFNPIVSSIRSCRHCEPFSRPVSSKKSRRSLAVPERRWDRCRNRCLFLIRNDSSRLLKG